MAQDTADNKTGSDKFSLTRLPKLGFDVVVTIPWKQINETREKLIEEIGKTIEVKGFRKGNAPKNAVLEKIDQQKLFEETLNKLVPGFYNEAIKKFDLKPIISPKIELVSGKEEEDWQIKFISCESPVIDLKNYKEELKKEAVIEKIWKPGEKETPKEEKSEDQLKEEKLDNAIKWLLENVKVEINEVLIDEEVGHRLSQLLGEIQKIGITVEQYLKSTNKSIEALKGEYRIMAEKNLAFEFILQRIAEVEKVEVKPEDIDKTIAMAKTEEEKKNLETQKYYLANILRKQKTIDFLIDLV